MVVSKEAGSSSFQAGHPGAPVVKAKNRSQKLNSFAGCILGKQTRG
jgi:hypothetical protein